MKIGLFGYDGKMGTEVARIVNNDRKHEIVSIENADVIIDFTSPEIVLENIKKSASLGKNIVVGTTGWYDRIGEVDKIVKDMNIGLIYAPNFSIGANIFFKIVSYASKMFKQFGKYDAYGLEIHHSAKKDAPSGTALRIAKEIDGLKFTSIRAGRNPGFHEVVFDSIADSISLSHAAHNRSGFAQGAIMAAEFIVGKKGVHTFEEIFS